MNHKLKLALLATTPIVILLSLSCQPTEASSTYYWKWPSTRLWQIRAYDTYLKFSSDLYCDKIGYDQFPDNTRWHFFNSYMDGGTVASWWWIGIQNGNVTIQKLFLDKVLDLNIQVASTATVQLYSLLGEPTSVVGASWEYADNVVTLTKSDSGKVTLSWVPEDYEWDPDLYVSPYGLLNQYLLKGDLFGLLFAIWYSLIGEVFLGVCAFILFFPMYRRTESILYPSLIMAIIGGASIGLTAILPFEAQRIHYIFALLGGAGVLYKVFGERD